MPDPELHEAGGLYTVDWVDEQVRILIDRVQEHRDGRIGVQILIETTAPGITPRLADEHVNINAGRTRSALAKDLEQKYPLEESETASRGWEYIVESTCSMVLEHLRVGEPAVRLSLTSAAPVRWILNPLIADRKPTILYGPGGSGKSYFALFVAMLVQNEVGSQPLNLFPSEQRNVLYLDWETDREDTEARASLISDGLGIPHLDPPLYRRCYSPLADDLSAISRIVSENDVGLVIVDSVAPACGGELGKEEVALRFYAAYRKLDVPGLLIGHVSKAEARAKRGGATPFGSVFFENIARLTWELRVRKDGEADLTEAGIFLRKTNITRRATPPIGFSLSVTDTQATFSSYSVPDGFGDEQSQPATIRDLLGREGAQTVKDVAEYLEVPQNQSRTILNRMRQQNEVAKHPDGRWGLVARNTSG